MKRNLLVCLSFFFVIGYQLCAAEYFSTENREGRNSINSWNLNSTASLAFSDGQVLLVHIIVLRKQ